MDQSTTTARILNSKEAKPEGIFDSDAQIAKVVLSLWI